MPSLDIEHIEISERVLGQVLHSQLLRGEYLYGGA
jgi:hypothetical protein